MLRSELLEIISNGENSGVEFKRDDIRPEQLAREIVAFANVQGGRIFLGVEDDGQVSGLNRDNAQEWVLNVFRDRIHPQIIPFYEEVRFDDGKCVAIISLGPGISKPYALRHNNREDTYVRMGDRTELVTREQQLRLFESGGLLHVESLPVVGTSLKTLDLERLRYYLADLIGDPQVPETPGEWTQRLLGMGLMAQDTFGRAVCSIAGLLTFGTSPRHFMKQAGIRLMAFETTDKDYQARLDVIVNGPLVGRWQQNENGSGELVDEGLIEKFAVQILPFISEESTAIDAHMRREAHWHYPWEAVRETVINALVHRDWTRSAEIEVVVYPDRLEVVSPGRMQNSMTIEKMVAGQRSPRNPQLVDFLRDYRYVDARGMGVRTKVIPLLKRHNGEAPIFEATDDFLKTTLPRGERQRQ